MSISVLILTLDEEANIERCLQSVAWSDDVLVLDSFSTDRTTSLARAHGARVMQRKFDSFAGQRNYGLTAGELRHEWVLHLDADEVVTPSLADELLETAKTGEKPAYRVASKMMLGDRWLRHAGCYPVYQVRFGRRSALSFVQVGHGQRGALPPEEVGTLSEPLLHYTFSKGFGEWFERHNRYAAAEAEHAFALRSGSASASGLFSADATTRRRALKDLSYRLPMRSVARFAYLYFLRMGFLDGRAGLRYAELMAIYEGMVAARLWERALADRGVGL